jgi:hypothetical protein
MIAWGKKKHGKKTASKGQEDVNEYLLTAKNGEIM